MILSSIFYIFASFLIVATLLPFIHKDHWVFRVFEFPRLQKFYLILLTIAFGALCTDFNIGIAALLGLLVLAAIYLGYLIFPFTILSKKTLPGGGDSDRTFSILISNVYQDNTDFHKLRHRIKSTQPDVILLVETDRKWKENLKECTQSYPYRIEYPQDNTYGLLFYSKLKAKEAEVRFLIKRDYPSIRVKLELPSGDWAWFYGVHPPPPSPTEKTYSTVRDSELMMVANEVSALDEPVIVAGDLNDVAWSYTTDQFLEVSELLDPRKGRGIYSTFHAKNVFMRWPLDHLFCSHHFGLVDMRRLKGVGSDHFPVLIKLTTSEKEQKT